MGSQLLQQVQSMSQAQLSSLSFWTMMIQARAHFSRSFGGIPSGGLDQVLQ